MSKCIRGPLEHQRGPNSEGGLTVTVDSSPAQAAERLRCLFIQLACRSSGDGGDLTSLDLPPKPCG